MRKLLLAIAALLLMIPNGGLQQTTALAAQNPANNLPKPTNYVSDFAHVLSPPTIQALDRICGRLDHSSADTQIAVVTVDSLQGADSAEFAKSLANEWGVGKKGSNRGVLLLLAINDHKWRISVGFGLEQILPNAKADSIGQKMIPFLRTGDFDKAATVAVRGIAQAVSAQGQGREDRRPQ
jgi:uncharacterized protein